MCNIFLGETFLPPMPSSTAKSSGSLSDDSLDACVDRAVERVLEDVQEVDLMD